MFRPLGVLVDLRPGTIATIGIERLHARTLFEQEDKPALERLIPYVRSALQLRLRLHDERRQKQAHAASLDALSFGAIICNAQAGVIFANEAAETLARDGAGIVLGPYGKGLRAIVPDESKQLARLINETATGGPGGVLRLSGRDGVPAFVLVTPLPGHAGDDSVFGHALVSVRSARDRPSLTTASLSALFQLSPAQAEIAIALYNGQSPDEIAAARNVRISTLRTHLAEIFARTRTENQRDFVRLLGMLPPLRRH
jgi:DNA-binding CsgD family transcriptional regulator